MSPKYWYGTGWEDDNGPCGSPESTDEIRLMTGTLNASDIGAQCASLHCEYHSAPITLNLDAALYVSGVVNVNTVMTVTGTLGNLTYGTLLDTSYNYFGGTPPPTDYTITAAAVNGAVTGTNPQTAANGTTLYFTVTPTAGYEIDGEPTAGSWINNTLTVLASFTGTVTVNFKLIGYGHKVNGTSNVKKVNGVTPKKVNGV